MDGVFSPEKNDTTISHFGEAVLILEHVILGHVRFKIFPPQLKLCLKTRQKTLTIVNFVNGHCLDHRTLIRWFRPAANAPYWCKECPLTELAYCIIAFRYGERFVMFSSEVLAEEGIFVYPSWPAITCSRIRTA